MQEYSQKTTINIVTVDVMFELISNDTHVQREVLGMLTDVYGIFDICYASTPVMVSCSNPSVKLRVKVPGISKILIRSICADCPHFSQCSEKVCGLRVYPNKMMSPCLNGYIISGKSTVKEKIEDIYPKLTINKNEIYSFFIHQGH